MFFNVNHDRYNRELIARDRQPIPHFMLSQVIPDPEDGQTGQTMPYLQFPVPEMALLNIHYIYHS